MLTSVAFFTSYIVLEFSFQNAEWDKTTELR